MGFVNRLFHGKEEVAFFVWRQYNYNSYIVREVIKLKKRLLALLLAAAVLFSFAVTFADEWDDEDFGDDEFEDEEEFEEEEGKVDFKSIAGYDTGEKYTSGDFIYQLPADAEGAVVISYTGTSHEMVIPDSLDDHPVVAIGDQAFNFLPIETATLPDTVRSIGNMAFYQCANLKQVTIQDGVVSIGTCCFGGDPLLEEVTIPETVETVDDFAFLACASLKEVSFGSALKKIGASAFQMCATLNKVTLPEAAEIGADAFTDCSPDLEIVKQ